MKERKGLKVVYIMEDCPAYELYGGKRPPINWNTADGGWVGIWGYDWGNQLGEQIVKIDEDITFEVRQPDLRADRIYEYTLNNGTVHKLYPAIFDNKGKYIYSEEMIKDIVNGTNRNTVVHSGVLGRFTASFLGRLNVLGKVGSFHSEIVLPIDNLLKLRKNVMNYRRVFSDHMKFKRLVNEFDVITYQTEYSLDKLRKYYTGKIERATMGTDFSSFVKLDKSKCRKELNLPDDKKILISVGRINSIKGQTEVVKELSGLSGDFNFLYIILGHGLERDYRLLMGQSSSLLEKSQILFPGYVRDEMLVKYLNASDVFLMPSVSEAGPVASMEALACGLPVITTETGSVCEFLKSQGCGMIIGRNDYEGFREGIKKFLSGCEIKIPDRNSAMKLFDWNPVAKKFIDIYRYAAEKRYRQG